MNVLVTGGRGFLGSRIVEELLEQGCTPSFSTRRKDVDARSFSARPTFIDLKTVTSRDLEGFDAVIHSAALKPGALQEAEYKQVNAEGTRHLVEACGNAGIRRFVHISTMAVEADRHDAYSTSKREAERHVQTSGLHWTIVRPGAVYGLSEWWIAYLGLMKKKRLIPVIGDGEYLLHQIYVKDCARAIVGVVSKAASNQRIYNAAADPITYNHYLTVLKASLQADFQAVHIPMWLGQLYAAGMKHVLRSPRPQYDHDPRRDVTMGSATTLDCGARPFELGLAEMLSELPSEEGRYRESN